MHVKYGGYSHGDAEVSLSTQSTIERNDADGKKWIRRTISLSGYLVGTDTSDIKSKALKLENAYALDGQDLRLINDEGGDTHIVLTSSECWGGTRVTQRPSFPDLSRAAYVTFLPYTIIVEGLVAITGAQSLVSFTERIARQGGGPKYGHLEPLTGPPIKQLLKKFSVYNVTQAGSAVGLTAYPTAPSPLWPRDLVNAGEFEHVAPRRIGAGTDSSFVEYEITWNYQFASKVPLVGNPNTWS